MRLLGHAAEAVLGRHFRLIYPPEAIAVNQSIQDLAAARRDGRCAVRAGCLRHDGEFPVEIGLNPIETEDGPMVLSAILAMSARV